MHFDWWTFGLQTINFAILVWLLHRFLYRPVLRLLDTRKSEIAKQFADAKAIEETAKARLADVEAQRTKIGVEHEQAIKAASRQADELASARKAQAEKEAATILEDARRTLAKEREAATIETRRAALNLASGMARRLIAEMPMERRAEAWLDRADQYLAGLPANERSALIAQCAGGAVVTVVTAAPLPDAAVQGWQDRLRKNLNANVVLKFEVDAALIAGVELHFPQSIVRFSFQSVLANIQSEIEAHGDSCR
ncbi:MAG: F0F1 ATP synthase subunit delta [Alphaproteobacteria bacterium]